MFVIELRDLLHAIHEMRKFIKLCPLIVGHADRHIDLNRCFDKEMVASSSVERTQAEEGYFSYVATARLDPDGLEPDSFAKR
jgi:hypothetical protein